MNKSKINFLGAIPGVITQVAPFLLPAIMFASGFLMILSPLPLFLFTTKNRSWIALIALLTNTAALFAVLGRTELFPLAVWLIGTVGFLFPFLIKRFQKVLPSFWFSFLFGCAIFYVTIVVVSLQENRGVVEFVKAQIAFFLESSAQTDPYLLKVLEEQGRDEVHRNIVDRITAIISTSYLSTFLVNLIFASRLLRGVVTKNFWASYKNPDWMVWPTLFCGASYAFGKFALYYIGLNGGLFLLSLYSVQGLSIISFLLNRAKIRGWARVFVFSFAFLVAMPVVTVFGFFDQWFDFRRKFGQTL